LGPGAYAQNPLHTFPRNFTVDGEAADLLVHQQVGMPTRPQQGNNKSLSSSSWHYFINVCFYTGGTVMMLATQLM